MVETLVITWRELLIVVALVLAVYVAEVLLLTRSAGKRGLFGGDREMKSLEAEVQALRAEVAALDERMGTLRGEFDELKRAQASTPYSQAIQLAQQGLEAGQIAANCGISRGEAELIVALNRADSP
jgi:cell division protein FtsB